jgi:hypothetical protein
MPKYSFTCHSCLQSKVLYTSVNTETVDCACGKHMMRNMPTLSGQEVRETIDSVSGKQWKQDQTEILKKRKEDHYWEVEVPRLVQKYSLETCLEQKWLKYNEKGELVINKAPSKR